MQHITASAMARFAGTFEATEKHELTCGKDGEYECGGRCGFMASFEAVEKHEAACKSKPTPASAYKGVSITKTGKKFGCQ